VAADRLRFDFSHPVALTAEDIAAVEAEVNAEIRANVPVVTRLMSPDDAIEAGAMALFGEKYGDEVRVLSMGRVAEKPYSVELCGGTHVRALGDIGVFRSVSEGAVSSGVRRIEALTGEAARAWFINRDEKAARGGFSSEGDARRSTRTGRCAGRGPAAARANRRGKEGLGAGRRRRCCTAVRSRPAGGFRRPGDRRVRRCGLRGAVDEMGSGSARW
jgi:hypothetical protein